MAELSFKGYDLRRSDSSMHFWFVHGWLDEPVSVRGQDRPVSFRHGMHGNPRWRTVRKVQLRGLLTAATPSAMLALQQELHAIFDPTVRGELVAGDGYKGVAAGVTVTLANTLPVSCTVADTPNELRRFYVVDLESTELDYAFAAPPPTVELAEWHSNGSSGIDIPEGLANSILVVFAYEKEVTASFDGVAMTAVPGAEADSPGYADQKAWYLLNPPLGLHAILCAAGASDTYKGAFVLANVDQADPFADVVIATGTGTAGGVTIGGGAGVRTINSIIGTDSASATNPTAGGDQTLGYVSTSAFFAMEMGGGHGGTAPSWTFDQSCNWAAVGLAIRGA